jgi:cation diffusion facilitator family transporter
MLKLLIRLFIHDSENCTDPRVRTAYGRLCGIYGIFLNLLLFAGKYAAGLLSGSVAITADAFNNLSDAGSSVITLLGFALAGKKADPEHPFGHGRIEYITGLAISVIIILVGADLGKNSFEKILHPTPVEAGLVPALILIAAIVVKVYISFYNRAIGKKIHSSVMEATALDALTDTISTFVVLISMAVSFFFKVNIDGWAGLIVALFIVYAGFSAAKDTIAPLLGKAPDPDFVRSIEETVLAHEEILGIHDLFVHDYGPGRVFISLHAEVDGHGDFFGLHDVVDTAETELKEKYGCLATIHMDPIDSANPEINTLRDKVLEALKHNISEDIKIHDFRVVPGPSHTNLIFDAAVPVDFKISDSKLEALIKETVSSSFSHCFAVVNIDRTAV